MDITIAIGTDHRGYAYKNLLMSQRDYAGSLITWIDLGCMSSERCDYPPFAKAVVQSMRSGTAQLGILLCGSGVGMAIAANRFKGIYAALAWDERVAVQSRADDAANILVIPADYVTEEQLFAMVSAWVSTQPKGGRYADRVAQINSWGGL